MFRSRPFQRILAAASGAAFLLVAGAASADHEDRRRDRRHRVVYHDDYCGARSDYRGHGRHDRHARHVRREVRREVYTCGPCNHRFHSRREFHRHLGGHHHIPLVALPFVIVRHTLGWIFHG